MLTSAAWALARRRGGPAAATATVIATARGAAVAALAGHLVAFQSALDGGPPSALPTHRQRRNFKAVGPLAEFVPPEPGGCAAVVPRNGIDLLHDSFWNKGTAFTPVERDRLKLRGLLPPRVMDMDSQLARIMDDVDRGQDFVDPATVGEDAGVDAEDVRRWKLLDNLATRNVTLFYKVLLSDFAAFSRIVYAPVIGFAAANYHKLYRTPRGMYFSADDAGEMLAMTHNWPAANVDAVVITDGSRVLGLGDLGLNGMAISVGKLALYCAAAGFHPARVLPVVVDVGTDNAALRDDPLYPGLPRPRLKGAAYYAVMDEVMSALMARWPKAVLQFEDVSLEHARPLLDRYKLSGFSVFNDDIQGTAAVAVAGVYGALACQGLPAAAITQQRFVVVGAGSAGSGVIRMLAAGMRKHGLSAAEAAARFHVLDKDGLITAARPGLAGTVIQPFAAAGPDDVEGEGLEAVIRRVRPTGLIGLAGAGRIFTPAVLAALGEGAARPLVFAMSNPTSRMECTSRQAAAGTGGRAVYASGSPQPDVPLDGAGQPLPPGSPASAAVRTFAASQSNNSSIFPGLARGAFLGQTGRVSGRMLTAAAEALPALLTQADLDAGRVYPSLADPRRVAAHVAARVLEAAAAEGLVTDRKALRALERAAAAGGGGAKAAPPSTIDDAPPLDSLAEWVRAGFYSPDYKTCIRPPMGVRDG